ncbi:MAG: MAPEG family protein [Alphaproteobacteria bacterium]|nr:MAPEG family protein [Alphaproteobacteria bacterium]MBU6473645.1 MAPEG family protein [Alphaproteobacteria bacterium]MDE2011419.1 MAPEG family protein [Alphaproteobacteria bacterium]MDE2071810.1 MAPEG family protein [Alphaproteobacteria bacterium]MDE2350416.1 MAPEG family protein [Alphaproteobacteria bacterium]
MQANASLEMQILFCAVVLGLIQLLLAILASVGGRGLPWAVGPRDEGWPALGKFGGRLERAWKNFIETFPLFAVAVLMVDALHATTATSALGTQIYIWARLIYLPVYVAGIAYLRTLVWMASLVGIVMVLAGIWPGM